MVNDGDTVVAVTKPTCNGLPNGDVPIQNGDTTTTDAIIPNGHVTNGVITDEESVEKMEVNGKEEGKEEVEKEEGKEEEKEEEKKEGENKNSENLEDVIVIQDTAFTIKIQPPGTDLFDLQVSQSVAGV